MVIDYKRIGKRIRHVRKKNGLSQADLADATGLSFQYISQIETGKKHASLESVVRIAIELNVTVDFLLNGFDSVHCNYEGEIHEALMGCTGFEMNMVLNFITGMRSSLCQNNVGIKD